MLAKSLFLANCAKKKKKNDSDMVSVNICFETVQKQPITDVL